MTGKLKCTTHADGATQVDTVIWTLSNFMTLLMAKKGQLRITCSKTEIGGKEHLKYNLKIRSDPWDKHRAIKVFFQSHESVLVAPSVAIKTRESDDIINDSNQMFSGSTNLNNCMATEPYKWHFLIADYNTSDYRSLVLQFTFKTYNVDSMNKILGSTRSMDFGELLTNELLYDAIIRSNDGEEFKAHKIILALRSSVLKTKFETNLNEDTTESKSVVKTEYSSKVVQQVLKFIYTNRVDINETTDVFELLDAAEHYHINGLKKLCEVSLCGKLTVTNAIQSLELALRYNLKMLEKEVLDFAKCNWNSLLKTVAWANLNSIQVFKRLAECHSIDFLNPISCKNHGFLF